MLAASAAAALLLLRPQEAASAVRAGLALCAGTVVPSLFPFFAAISLLLQLGAAEALGRLCAPIMRPLFRMRGVCALPLLAGLLGGYPSGAKTAASLYAQGRITRQEAELLLGFCDNCGPAFLLGCVGAGVLGDPAAGLWLYAVHILSALLAGLLLCRLRPVPAEGQALGGGEGHGLAVDGEAAPAHNGGGGGKAPGARGQGGDAADHFQDAQDKRRRRRGGQGGENLKEYDKGADVQGGGQRAGDGLSLCSLYADSFTFLCLA